MSHYEKNRREIWMSDDQWECFELIALIFGGFNHTFGRVSESWNGDGIRFVVKNVCLSTIDYSDLTLAVVASHDRMIRLCISPSSSGSLAITCQKRHKRKGDIREIVPTIEDAILTARNKYN